MINFSLRKYDDHVNEALYHEVRVETAPHYRARMVVKYGYDNTTEPTNDQGIDLDAKELRALAAQLQLVANWIDYCALEAADDH